MKDFTSIISEHFKIPGEEIKDEMTPREIPEWDSMNYLLLIAEVEKEYGVSFDMNEVMGMASLGDIKQALRAKGIAL